MLRRHEAGEGLVQVFALAEHLLHVKMAHSRVVCLQKMGRTCRCGSRLAVVNCAPFRYTPPSTLAVKFLGLLLSTAICCLLTSRASVSSRIQTSGAYIHPHKNKQTQRTLFHQVGGALISQRSTRTIFSQTSAPPFGKFIWPRTKGRPVYQLPCAAMKTWHYASIRG